MAESGDAERRALLPPPLIAVDDQQLKQSSGYYQLQGATIAGKVGGRLFYTVTTPASGEVRCVITFVHGFADSQGYVHQNTIRAHAQRLGACVIGVDMPGHGLSDGLIVHIPDWFEFIGAGEEAVIVF
jgi:pimeloyl-ACP methyl ester carboxylesterase